MDNLRDSLKKQLINIANRAENDRDFTFMIGRWQEEPVSWNENKLIKKFIDKKSYILDLNSGKAGQLLLNREPVIDLYDEGNPDNRIWREVIFGTPFEMVSTEQPAEAEPLTAKLPEDMFDVVLNRGNIVPPKTIAKLLKTDGIYFVELTGDQHNVDLAERIIGKKQTAQKSQNLMDSVFSIEREGFQTLFQEESFPKLKFFDLEAFVFYANAMKGAFPDFDIEERIEQLEALNSEVVQYGHIICTQHRMMMVFKKI